MTTHCDCVLSRQIETESGPYGSSGDEERDVDWLSVTPDVNVTPRAV